MKVKTELVKLDIAYPRNIYQPSCLWVHYGFGCGLDITDSRWRYGGAVGAGATATAIPWSGATTPNFQQGILTFTSGVCDGEIATIRQSTGGVLTLSGPLTAVPGAGDSFVANWGCDLTNGAQGCALYDNQAKRRSYDFVPPPSTAF